MSGNFNKISMPFDVGNVADDFEYDTSLEARERRSKIGELYFKAITHIWQCEEANCEFPKCIIMKAIVRHFMYCELPEEEECFHCKYFATFVSYHARRCDLEVCPLPVCKKVRQRIREFDVHIGSIQLEPSTRGRNNTHRKSNFASMYRRRPKQPAAPLPSRRPVYFKLAASKYSPKKYIPKISRQYMPGVPGMCQLLKCTETPLHQKYHELALMMVRNPYLSSAFIVDDQTFQETTRQVVIGDEKPMQKLLGTFSLKISADEKQAKIVELLEENPQLLEAVMKHSHKMTHYGHMSSFIQYRMKQLKLWHAKFMLERMTKLKDELFSRTSARIPPAALGPIL